MRIDRPKLADQPRQTIDGNLVELDAVHAYGREHPGARGSYYEKKIKLREYIVAAAWTLATASYLILERGMI